MTSDIAALEQAELDAFTDLYRAASADVATAGGVSVTGFRGGVVLAANRVDVLALNRMIGLGLNEQVSDETLDDVLAVLTRAGSPRFFVPVAPVDGHRQLAEGLERKGLRHYNNWIRLTRDTTSVPQTTTELVVREIDRSSALAFGEIVSVAFGYPPAVAPLVGQTVGRGGWRHYLAYSGDTPVAAAAMYLSTDAAWFGFAATDTRHRGRGAQQALVVRRLRDASDAGCTRISVETAEDSVVRNAPSFRNLRRLGFEVAYVRPNYLWTKSAAPPG